MRPLLNKHTLRNSMSSQTEDGTYNIRTIIDHTIIGMQKEKDMRKKYFRDRF